jgi:cell division protein FtsW (lipid II flippase)
MTAKRKRKAAPADRHPALYMPAITAVACGFLALLGLRLANAPVWDAHAAGFAILLGAVAGGTLIIGLLMQRIPQPAVRALIASTTFLAGIGILMQHRVKGIQWNALTASDLAYPVGIVILIGTVLLLKNARYRHLSRFGVLGILASIVGMVGLIAIGTRFRGAVFYPGHMTPTELIKPLAILFLASQFRDIAKQSTSRRRKRNTSGFAWRWAGFGLLWGGLMVLFAIQRDLGMILILNTVLVCTIYAAFRRHGILLAGGAMALAGTIAVLVLAPHARHRFDAWLDPFAAPTGKGWQVLQSLSALYNGGLLGTGLGEGSPQAIPVASSDFIYAAIGEELGIIGCALILIVFSLLLSAGYRIAGDCKDPFGRLLAVGLTTSLAIQIILNVGGVTKGLPLTGVPLPFVSHGGMNILVSALMIGMLVAIGLPERRRAKKRKPRR